MLSSYALADIDDPWLSIEPEDVVFTEVGVHEITCLPVNRYELEQVLEDLVWLIDGDVLESRTGPPLVADIFHYEDILQAIKRLRDP